MKGGRSPYGERGLKYIYEVSGDIDCGRSPYGERGLKSNGQLREGACPCRSPYGERGLKSEVFRQKRGLGKVAPRTGSVD